LLPGSRSNEIKYLLKDFMHVADNLLIVHPDLLFVVPTLETVKEKVSAVMAHWKTPHLIVTGERERYNAFAASSAALAASGTVSLELALAGVPHLIAYRLNKLTAWLARRLLKIKYVNLLNLLENKPLIPELLQENCTVEKMTQVMDRLIKGEKQDVTFALAKLRKETNPSDQVVDKLIQLARNA